MKVYVFESVVLLISSIFLFSSIIAFGCSFKCGGYDEDEKLKALWYFAASGAFALIFGARMIYLLAVEAGMNLF